MKVSRNIDKLIGLCQGILADGVLVQEEAEFLLSWLQRHQEISGVWPANVLYERLVRALEDGVMDSEEERELVRLLLKVDAEASSHEKNTLENYVNPLDDPAPPIVFRGRRFCFTGDLVCGTRAFGESCVVSRGGHISTSVTLRTDYLVIGAGGSPDWSFGSFGNKIERAVELRARKTTLPTPCGRKALA